MATTLYGGLLAIAVLLHTAAITSTVHAYELVYAINAGGDDHTDLHGIHYERDPLHDSRTGIASDYGKNLMAIGRVEHQPDEYLYQTERYHTATFGYELPVREDGAYVLQLKFCEVYFNAANLKVFDVRLNGEHTVVSDLDIFREVGRGVAHDEHVHFTVVGGRLIYGDDESQIREGQVRVEFIKGYRDNPKINAIALYRGDVEDVPRLPPLDSDGWLDAEPVAAAPAVPAVPTAASKQQQQQQQQRARKQQQQQQRQATVGDDDAFHSNDDYERPSSAVGGSSSRKTSGPKQEDPYALDDSSVMLPVFIAIGAFIPLLFCLCKL